VQGTYDSQSAQSTRATIPKSPCDGIVSELAQGRSNATKLGQLRSLRKFMMLMPDADLLSEE